ncbi:hypothetical protein E5D57_004628 [Metarhizium anisopliae]|nr:hypothetical protein E5D57_004628 [Metarhizium anisopliae]
MGEEEPSAIQPSKATREGRRPWPKWRGRADRSQTNPASVSSNDDVMMNGVDGSQTGSLWRTKQDTRGFPSPAEGDRTSRCRSMMICPSMSVKFLFFLPVFCLFSQS